MDKLFRRFLNLAYNTTWVFSGACLILKFTVADCIGNHIIFCYFGELLIYVRRQLAKIAILF